MGKNREYGGTSEPIMHMGDWGKFRVQKVLLGVCSGLVPVQSFPSQYSHPWGPAGLRLPPRTLQVFGFAV